MKKIMIQLVLTFVCTMSTAQNLYSPIKGFRDAGQTAILADGSWVDITSYEGWNHYEEGLTIAQNWNNQRNKLVKENPQLATNVYGYGGMMGTGNVMMNGVMMNGVMMNGQGGAMVYGSSGAATAQSQLVVTDRNKLSTLGSTTQGSINVDSNGKVNFNLSGDLLGGVARTIDYFTGSGKKKTANGGFTNGQVLQDTNGNLYLMQNGQLVPLQQQVQYQQVQQPVQQQVVRQQQVTRTAQPVQQQVVRQQQVTRTAQPVQQTTYTTSGDFSTGW